MTSINSHFQPITNGTLRRLYLPRTSRSSSFLWWTLWVRKWAINIHTYSSRILRLLDPRRLWGKAPPPPTPWPIAPKGPQVWDFPPPAKSVNRLLEPGQERACGSWKNEETGWVMFTIAPRVDCVGPNGVRRTVLYFHGSGFLHPINNLHWGFAGYLSRWLEAEVVVVPYPLGPNNPGPEWRPQLLSVYREFLARAGDKEVILVGDSAGAMICLGLAHDLYTSNIPLPHQIVVISVPTELRLSEREAMLAIEPYDNILTVEYCHLAMHIYAGIPVSPSASEAGLIHAIPIPDEVALNPAYSPKNGDPSIFREAGTKLIVVNGEWDVLYPNAEAYVEKLAAADVDVTYIVGQQQCHIWPTMLGLTPEARMAADTIIKAIVANGGSYSKGSWSGEAREKS
ncbi:alpha/beta-hydrolase [Clavulina sp. PMI_390]|nr:alpha/beta-hydrolase [Clavulina sp. PMI_390]